MHTGKLDAYWNSTFWSCLCRQSVLNGQPVLYSKAVLYDCVILDR